MENYTIIDTNGKVIRQGTGGITIVSPGTTAPVLTVSEVSDDDTVNLFLRVGENCSPIVQSETDPQTWEILKQR
jgi:hypothetical protein